MNIETTFVLAIAIGVASVLSFIFSLIFSTWFLKRVDRLLYIIETLNKIPAEGADEQPPSDEEFRRQAIDFVNNKQKEPDEIIVEKYDDGKRANVKPAEKKAELI